MLPRAPFPGWRIFLAVAVGGLAAVLGPGRATALVVATYNVENYLSTDRQVAGVFRKEYPKPEKEKAALRQAIAGLGADILALEEMGTLPYLEELQADLRREGVDYPHAVVLEAGDPARHVALLSRLPFQEVRRHAAMPIKLFGQPEIVKRGVLEATFATDAGELTVFVIHLKSRRTELKGDPEGAQQRAAEAEAVRDLVLARFPNPAQARFILLGDWNDHRTSRPVRALQKRGKTEIGEILRGYDSRGETWTHHFRLQDSYSRIDFILVSPGLQPLLERPHARIHDGPGVREASDHRPIAVSLKMEPAG